MEIKLPFGGVLSYAKPSQDAVSESSPSQMPSAANAVKIQESTAINDKEAIARDKDGLQEVLQRTIDLVSMLDRSLKFEMIEEAGLYQIQVIDSSDGRIVRKIPSDEVVKLITHIKEKLSDRVDVVA